MENIDPRILDARILPDRRHDHQGPRAGQPDRRTTVRRATDALKMACPFCGHSESAVVRSRGGVTIDHVGRRRECAGCGRRWPTSERVDWAALERELGLVAAGDADAITRALALKNRTN